MSPLNIPYLSFYTPQAILNIDPLLDLLPAFLGNGANSPDVINMCRSAKHLRRLYGKCIKELTIQWRKGCQANSLTSLLQIMSHLVKLNVKGVGCLPSLALSLTSGGGPFHTLIQLDITLDSMAVVATKPPKYGRSRSSSIRNSSSYNRKGGEKTPESFLSSMATALRANCLPALESLRIDRGIHCDCQVSVLLRGLEDGTCPHLQRLILPHLYSNDEWMQDFEQVCDMLEKRKQQSPHHCRGLAYIDLPFSYLPASIIMPIMQICLPTLEFMEWENIDHPSILWDWITIAGAPALKEIWIQVDHLHYPAVPSFVKALDAKVLPELTKLVICGDTEEMEDLIPLFQAIQQGKCPKLTHLRFFPQGLKDKDIALIMDSLTGPRSPKHLTSLIFGGNVITEGMKSIAATLADCKNLPNLETLGLNGCIIKDDGLIELSHALGYRDDHRSIGGSSSSNSSRGARRKLKYISMEDCGIGDKGIKAFVKILASSFPYLKELRLDRNTAIGQDGIESIVRAMQSSSSSGLNMNNLECLTLAIDHIVNRNVQEVAKAMNRGDWERVKAFKIDSFCV